MRKLLTFGLLVTLATISLLFTGCSGEDGEPGPQGEKGLPGTGLGEFTQLGAITATFSGTRVDGVAFKQTTEYEFSKTGTGAPVTSSWRETTSDGVTERRFMILRYTGLSGSDFSSLQFTEKKGEISFETLDVYATIVAGDRTFFTVNCFREGAAAFADGIVSDYAFNAVTGELKFNYSFTFAKGSTNNTTGHDIQITLDVDVMLYKQID